MGEKKWLKTNAKYLLTTVRLSHTVDLFGDFVVKFIY